MPNVSASNEMLFSLLQEAGLSPRGLARELNKLCGPGTVAQTTPYHWRDHGGVPRIPLRAPIAVILSRQLNRVMTVGDLWPDEAGAGDLALYLPASRGLDGPWTLATTMRVADDWLLGGLVDRRVFLAVGGTALAKAVSIYLAGQQQTGLGLAPTVSPADPLVDQIEASVPQLQMLDDEQGGAAGLSYVGAQVRAVLLVLREGGKADATTRRLLVALADLAQLAGWKALDAAQPGLAQRYLLTGLRAAHDAGYREMEAHILADLAFQAASMGDSRDGVALGEAAQRVAKSVTASVQASVASRLAFAYAAEGRVAECERAWLDSQNTLTHRRSGQDPSWMYYLTANHLDCQAGYSLILAGRRLTGDRAGRSLLRKGESLLRTGAYNRPLGAPSQRRALYEAAWLALGYTAHGKLEESAAVVRTAIPRLEHVRSPRSIALLSTLAKELHRRKRSQVIADVLPDLEAALARRPG